MPRKYSNLNAEQRKAIRDEEEISVFELQKKCLISEVLDDIENADDILTLKRALVRFIRWQTGVQ